MVPAHARVHTVSNVIIHVRWQVPMNAGGRRDGAGAAPCAGAAPHIDPKQYRRLRRSLRKEGTVTNSRPKKPGTRQEDDLAHRDVSLHKALSRRRLLKDSAAVAAGMGALSLGQFV